VIHVRQQVEALEALVPQLGAVDNAGSEDLPALSAEIDAKMKAINDYIADAKVATAVQSSSHWHCRKLRESKLLCPPSWKVCVFMYPFPVHLWPHTAAHCLQTGKLWCMLSLPEGDPEPGAVGEGPRRRTDAAAERPDHDAAGDGGGLAMRWQ
jgi:hypothetical protein